MSYRFGDPAVLDSGITLHAGNAPLKISTDEIGDDIRGELKAIASAGATVGVVEVYGD